MSYKLFIKSVSQAYTSNNLIYLFILIYIYNYIAKQNKLPRLFHEE